jgi:ligand-binding sensor domain-containing protein
MGPRSSLKNLNISREPKTGHRWLYPCIHAALIFAFAANICGAADAKTAMSPYTREWWGQEQGFPGGPVYAIAQTPDGYLWIGTEKGLIRFDGLNFVLFPKGTSENSPRGPVLGLVTDAEGSLWIRQEAPNLLRYRSGKFENLLPLLRQQEGGITAMANGKDGEVLLSGLVNGPARYKAGRFQPLVERGLPNFLSISLAETADGRVWMGSRDAGLSYATGNQRSGGVPGLPDRKINCLLAFGGQELWIGTDNGVVRWDGERVIKTGLPRSLAHLHALAMIKDREFNVWVGSSSGLFRLNGTDYSSFELSDQQVRGGVTALFEDREGNVWVGSALGLERLRRAEFTTYSDSGRLPSDANGSLYVDLRGRTWFAPMEGGLYWLREGQLGKVNDTQLDKDVVYSITGGKGDLWVGRQRGGLTHLRDLGSSFSTETYTQNDGLAQNSVYAVHQNRDGSVWAGTLSAGVSNFHDGKFTTYTTQNGLASNSVASIAEGSDGTMWFGTPNGLNAFSGGRWRVYSSRDGLPPGTVNCLLPDSEGVLWIGTANGLAFFDSGGVIRTPAEEPASLHEQIFGIEEDKTGSLWIATSNHVLRINREKLFGLALADTDVREYGVADGLHSIEVVKRHRSVVADLRGQIWFSTSHGISVINPTRTLESSAPAIVHVEGISADGRRFIIGKQLRIPAPHQRITLGYLGLSLSVPARVRFKYKLDGFDSGWSEPTPTREATYTNLASGSYLFHVVASNSHGLWNSSESTLQFEIEPAFWQTRWFRISTILMMGLAIMLFFRLRVSRLMKQMTMRFDERLAERTRIAQELHDTLLQGFLSASMQLHVANDNLPTDSPAKPLVGRVLELMGHVIEEGRNAVRGLRTSKMISPDLELAFSQIRQEFPVQSQIGFRVIVEGRPRPLDQVIRDDVYLIGREALSNAFRHAHASHIEVELEYAPSHLRVLVRDNGSGIDALVLHSGRDGHWGLSGMKERAQRIGGKLRVLSSEVAGTEVELSVPAQIAFESRSDDHSARWFSRFYRATRRNKVSQSESGKAE